MSSPIAKSSFWLKRLYARCLAGADSAKAKYWLYAIAFAESSFFPLPPDFLFVPMALSKPKKAFGMAFWLTVASVAGGTLGYGIGYYLYDSLGAPIIEAYDTRGVFIAFKDDFAKYGFWIIALKGLTPIPYKLVTIASGLAKFDFAEFMTASLIARGFRFYLVATLLYFYGEKARVVIEKRLGLALLVALSMILAGFAMIRFIPW